MPPLKGETCSSVTCSMFSYSFRAYSNIWLIFFYELFIFQNVHLLAHWLPFLDAFLEAAAKNSHPNYRLFITGEPAPSPEQHVIPRGILEDAIKITNEPPTGLKSSLHAALNNFSQVCLNFHFYIISVCSFYRKSPVLSNSFLISGHSGYVFQRTGLQLDVLLALLLPCVCYRAP